MALYKYEVLYTRDSDGKEKRFLIYLGKLSQNHKPIITPETYAYRILSSELRLTDLASGIDREYVYRTSVKHFIGYEYSVDTYYAINPDDHIFNVDYLTPIQHTVIETCTYGDSENKRAVVLRKNSLYTVMKHSQFDYGFNQMGMVYLKAHFKYVEI